MYKTNLRLFSILALVIFTLLLWLTESRKPCS